MSRCYTDRVEVLRRNDEPAHFLWRSRLYVVRGVLAHWVETAEWLHSGLAETPPADEAAPHAPHVLREPTSAGSGEPTSAGAGEPIGGRAAGTAAGGGGREDGRVEPSVVGLDGSTGAVATAVVVPGQVHADRPSAEGPDHPPADEDFGDWALDDDREIWRVEASSGRSGTPGVYDLCFACSSGSWTLMHTADAGAGG